jgi:hypothetical protein
MASSRWATTTGLRMNRSVYFLLMDDAKPMPTAERLPQPDQAPDHATPESQGVVADEARAVATMRPRPDKAT